MYGALAINPLVTAGGSIAMRKMKKFHYSVVSTYLNLCIGLTSAIIMLAFGESFTFWKTWGW